MGACRSFPRYRVVRATTLFINNKTYPSKIPCKLKQRNFQGQITGFTDLLLDLSYPLLISSCKSPLSDIFYWTSTCVLPSIDIAARPMCSPPSQDLCRVISHNNLVFIMLFDGFGQEGQKVSQFCVDESEDYFFSNCSVCSVIAT